MRLSLVACNEAVSVLPTQVDFLVRECFNWFAHSPKRQQEYHAVFAAINSGDRPKKLVGLSGTRWLSIAGAIRTVLNQWVELKTHFEFAKTTERCYTAKVLSDMFNDDLNLLLLRFLSPIIDEFDRMNKLFQSENPDPSKLYSDLLSFMKCLMLRVVLPNHASSRSNWEAHIMHVRACDMGGVFRDCLERSTLSEDVKTGLLERCRQFLVECVKSVLKRFPSNMSVLENLHLLRCSSMENLPFHDFFKAFSSLIRSADVSSVVPSLTNETERATRRDSL